MSRPTQSNYRDLLDGFNPDSLAPYAWVFATSVIAFGITVASGYLAGASFATRYICGPIGIGVVAVLSWVLLVGLVNVVAQRLFGGSGDFAKLFYLSSAATALLTIATSLLAAILRFGTLNTAQFLILGAYEIALITVATKVVHDLSWWKAAMLVVPFFGILRVCDTLT